MPALWWRYLSLSGFGCYHQEVEVRFHRGLNVYIAPNEQGKSTLVAALEAVIFGLPKEHNPEVFGSSRYLPWERAASSYGRLEFQVGENIYLLERDLETNRVTLKEQREGEWRKIWAGTHNPKGRKSGSAYADYLRSLLGLSSRESFEATFCVTQPLPRETALNREVERLITGGGTYQEALGMIEEELKALTRQWRRLELSSRDGDRPRKLEELEEEIRRLEGQREAALRIVEEMRSLQEREEELRKELDFLRQERDKKQELERSWERWKNYQYRYRTFMDSQRQMRDLLERAQRLQEKIKDGEGRVALLYPEWRQSPEVFSALEELEGTVKEREELEAKERNQREKCESLREELQNMRLRFQEYQDIYHRPHICERLNQLKDMEGDYRRWREKKGLLLNLKDFSPLGEHPLNLLERLHREAPRVVSFWERFQEGWREYREVKEQREQLEKGLKGIDPAEALEALKQRPRVLAEMAAHRERQRLRVVLSFLLSLLGMGLGFFLSGLLGLSPFRWLLLSLTGLLAGAVGWTAFRGKDLSPWKEELSRLEARLGPFREEGDLKELETRLETYQELLSRERELEGNLRAWALEWTASSELREDYPLEEKAAGIVREYRALAGLEGFCPTTWSQLAGWLESKDSLWWEDLKSQARSWQVLKGEMAQLQARWGLDQKACPHLEQAWEEEIKVRCQEVAPFSLETPLEEAQARLRTAREMAEAIKEKEGKLQEGEGLLRSLKEDIEKLLRREEELRGKLQEILKPAGGDIARARQRYEDFRQEAEQIEQWRRELKGVLGDKTLSQLQREYIDLENQVVALLRDWQGLIDRHPGLPPAGEVGEEVERSFARLKGEIEELEGKIKNLEEEERQILKREAELEGQEIINLAQAEEMLRQKKKELERVDRQIRALSLAWKELMAAGEEFHLTYREKLGQLATGYFARFTRTSRRVVLNPDFSIAVYEGDIQIALSQLSRGAQDQLYLALRLALGDVLCGFLDLPFIFDDCFINCDRYRREKIKESLTDLARRRQILLFSHDPDFASWGQPIVLRPKGEG